jgi:hypothetical protein
MTEAEAAEAGTRTDPEPEITTETETETGTEVEVQPEAEVTQSSAKKPGKGRSISTVDLYAGALLLAIVGGAAIGYTIQALRPPTPLPPPGVAQPAYPPTQVYSGVRPPALPAAQDDATVVEGDLTKLLLPTPSGATVPGWAYDHSWQDITGAALYSPLNAVGLYQAYIREGVLRVADTGWRQNDIDVEIQIIQYAPGESDNAARAESYGNSPGTSIAMPPGVKALGSEYKDTSGVNTDYAVAVHGDLEVVFYVNDAAAVPDPALIDDLITQQMARL